MRTLLHHIGLSLRLNLRNRMAMVYGFLFPLIFLLAFLVLYRADRVPLALHLGELLTVTALGGACFGLPATLVSERERGVWRRYRLTPLPVAAFVVSLLATRYVLLIAAALMQLAIALEIGMPVPADPPGLIAAFTGSAVAFMGIGLVIAMLADTVPAVQALGQCIFLPMLMIGGVAVPLASLPDWARHLSAFFPGRYSVEAIQACVTGPGLSAIWFPLAALLLIGLAGGIAAAMMFRWDAGARPGLKGGRWWLLLALGMWGAIGLAAELRHRVAPSPSRVPEEVSSGREYLGPLSPAARRSAAPTPGPVRANAPAAPHPPAPVAPETPMAASAPPSPSSWQDVTPADLAGVAYDRLPPDAGIVAPIATVDEAPEPPIADQLAQVRAALPDWPPGQVADPVQRARNLLYVAAVPDALQMTGLERFLPVLVYERLRATIPREDLARILYWIATHPNDGDDAAAHQLAPLGLPDTTMLSATVRTRAMLYAFKLAGRLTGAIVQK